MSFAQIFEICHSAQKNKIIYTKINKKSSKKSGAESVVFRYGFNRSFTVPIERTKEINELNDHEKEIFVKNWNESNKSLYSKQYICDTAKNGKPIYKKETLKGLTFEEIIKKVVK